MADLEPSEEFGLNEELSEEPESGSMLSQADLDALIAAAGQAVEEQQGSEEDPEPSEAAPGMAGIDLPSFAPAAPPPPLSYDTGGGMGRVRDIPLEVTVELGRTRLLIRDIMDLSAGSIIELDKIAGEPVDLFANGMLVARGEVIVIDDNFGVRVTEIITARDRDASEKDTHARAA